MFNILEELSRKGRKETREIARALLKNPDLVIYMSITELAKKLGTNPATLVRFAKKAGYKGFPEFRKAIAKELGLYKTPLDFFREAKDEQDISKFITSEIKSLSQTFSTDIIERLESASKLLSQSKEVLIAGSGTAGALAYILYGYLTGVGLNVSVASDVLELTEKLHRLKKDGVFIAISYLRHFRMIVEAIKKAKERKIKIIAITDNSFNPVGMYADICIPVKVKRLGLVISLSGVIGIIDALGFMVSLKRPEETEKTLKLIEKIWQEENIFWEPD